MTATPMQPRVTGLDSSFGFRLATPQPGCDFCAVPLTGRWIRFGCRDFTRRIPGTVPFAVRMVGHWVACSDCAPIVRHRRWRDLIDHVTAIRVAAGITDAGHPEVRAELAALYLQLERELTGTETEAGAA